MPTPRNTASNMLYQPSDNIVSDGNVVAHGIDIVDTSRFTALVNTLASNYLGRYFTPQELLSAGGGVRRAEKLASRFAAKEAVLKALRTGWGNGVSFEDVEIVHNHLGAPSIQLHRHLKNVARDLLISHWIVTTSHTGHITIASVIGLSSSTTKAKNDFQNILNI